MKEFIRNHVAVYSSMFKGRSSAWEIARYAVEKGVGGIELMSFCDELREPDMKTARELGAFAKEYGLALPCFSVGIGLVGDNREEQLDRLKGYADICAELGIPYLHHTIASRLVFSEVNEHIDEYFNIGVESALIINEYADKIGVKTVVEDQGFVFNGVDNFAGFRKATDERVGTVLDVGNIMFVDERAEDFARAFSDSIKHVHIKDYKILKAPHPERNTYATKCGDRLLGTEFGKGDVNFGKISDILKDIGYSGFYALEFDGLSDLAEADRDLAFVASTFGN